MNTRRSVLRRALAVCGVGGVGSIAGCTGLLEGSDSPETSANPLHWLPTPAAVTGAERFPFHLVRPGAVSIPPDSSPGFEYYSELPIHVSTHRDLLPVSPESVDRAIAAARLRVAIGAFDVDALEADLHDTLTDRERYEGFDVYTDEERTAAVCLSSETVVTARHAPARDAVSIVEAAVDAGADLGDRYVDSDPRAAAFPDRLADRDLVFWMPSTRVETAVPEAGRFPAELGYGAGVSGGDEGLESVWVRSFEGGRAPGTAAVDRWTSAWEPLAEHATSVDGDAIVAHGELSYDADGFVQGVSTHQLTPHVRDVTDEPPDGADTVVEAALFIHLYERADGTREPVTDLEELEPGTELTLALRSLDVVHGVEIESLGLERLVAPGEERVVSFEVPEEDLEIRCSRYCGRAHHDMHATIPVAS